MAKNITSNAYEGGLTVDPSIAPGVPATIGALYLRVGTAEVWQKFGALDTDWDIIAQPFNFVFNPYGVAGGNLYTDFAAVVAAMQLADGFKILQFDNTRNGVGDELSIPVAGTVRLRDSSGLFAPNMVGQLISIDGATVLSNIGQFTITAFIDVNNIEYTNAAGVAEPLFSGAWLVTGGGGSINVTIPPNAPVTDSWDMTLVEWFGYINPWASVGGAAGIPVVISDGASFSNLRKITGDLIVVNQNNTPNPAPVRVTQSQIFEFGLGVGGDFPQLDNQGTAPFWDCTTLPAAPGGQFTMRVMGVIGGATAAIDLGAGAGGINCHLEGFLSLRSGMIRGTNPLANLNIANRGERSEVNRQDTPLSPYAGRINYGRQTANNIPRPFMQLFPESLNQAPPVPVGAIPAASLGHNGSYELTSAGVAAFVLPLIRAATPANNLSALTPGLLNSTGMQVVVKHRGAGSISVTPNATTPDTIDGVAGPVIVPTGGSRTFQSDGVSNWRIIGGYL